MTATTLTPAPAPGGDDERATRRLAMRLRSARGFAAAEGRLVEADLMREAAEALESPRYPLVHDAEELDALALDPARPLAAVALLDRFGQTFTAHPDHAAERLTIVRTPALHEAQAGRGDEWPVPLAFDSTELEHARFPMRVLHTTPAWLPPAAAELAA